MADLFVLALTVFTFQNNTKIAINIYLLDIFALFLVFSYQFTAKCFPVNIGISAWYSLIVSAYQMYQNRISYINTVWN